MLGKEEKIAVAPFVVIIVLAVGLVLSVLITPSLYKTNITVTETATTTAIVEEKFDYCHEYAVLKMIYTLIVGGIYEMDYGTSTLMTTAINMAQDYMVYDGSAIYQAALQSAVDFVMAFLDADYGEAYVQVHCFYARMEYTRILCGLDS